MSQVLSSVGKRAIRFDARGPRDFGYTYCGSSRRGIRPLPDHNLVARCVERSYFDNCARVVALVNLNRTRIHALGIAEFQPFGLAVLCRRSPGCREVARGRSVWWTGCLVRAPRSTCGGSRVEPLFEFLKSSLQLAAVYPPNHSYADKNDE